MLWTNIFNLFFGAAVVIAPLPDPMRTQASMQELLTYECGKSVAEMLAPEEQAGPVFAVEDLVFTGVEASDNSRMLIVTAGDGAFAIPLVRAGVNRIRFSLPTRGADKRKEFYLGFLYDSVTRSRFFDFAADRPPMGKEETDYAEVQPQRSENLLPNLEYKIHETAEGMLASLTEGRLSRKHVISQKADNCEHITRKTPALGRNLKRNLDVVEQIVLGPQTKPAAMVAAVTQTTRGPASVGAIRKP